LEKEPRFESDEKNVGDFGRGALWWCRKAVEGICCSMSLAEREREREKERETETEREIPEIPIYPHLVV
jgi:hypothetical protein